MKAGEVFRLMDLYNVRLAKRGKVSQAEFVGDERLQELRKVQWVVDDADKRRSRCSSPQSSTSTTRPRTRTA